MKKDPDIFLRHILESIEWVEEYLKDVEEREFFASERAQQIQDSVIRRLEIIGEAVRNLPEDFRKEHREIPWDEIAGMRDILIHEYFGVDVQLVWDTATSDLPKLKEQISLLLKNSTRSG